MEIQDYQPERFHSRRMWTYPSEKHFLNACSYILRHNQMAERAVSIIKISAEQKKIMQPGLKRILNADFWDRDEFYPDSLFLQVPWKALGNHEAAVAQFDKILREEDCYLLPIKIYSSIE